MFATKLKQAMADKGMTQAQLSREAEIPRSSLCQYLSGNNIPRKDKLNRIAAVLGVRPEWLTAGTKITIAEAAQIMGVSAQFLRIALQKGIYDFGEAVQLTGERYTYHINPKRFENYINGEL